MLSKPHFGWSEFQLEGTSEYSLSYLDDIAYNWVGQAIHGLETLLPFTVKGFLEPGRFLCTVSYWNCHIICEDEDKYPLEDESVITEISHTSMIEFCQYLHDDISVNLDEWVNFLCMDEDDFDFNQRKDKLISDLSKLQKLIDQNKEHFGPNRCFL